MSAEDYSYEKLRRATENWRKPVLVKGLFKGTKGVENWDSPDYLPSRMGHLTVPVYENASLAVPKHEMVPLSFGDAFNRIRNGTEPKALFFPVKSRFLFHSNYSTTEVSKHINEVVKDDLDLDRIYEGFGGPYHLAYQTAQFVAAHGSKYGPLEGQEKVPINDGRLTTGTSWHCAMASNWFILVVGKKRWYFMDPKYSLYMQPAINGKVSVQTFRYDMSDILPHLPLQYADVEAGDLLFNPDWYWHRVENYPGFVFAVPIREFVVTRSLANNAMYTLFGGINKFLGLFGGDLGGKPCCGLQNVINMWQKGYEDGAALYGDEL
eukprot:scaffold585_cov237-Pinguiococcus_pyrenoidosus.AAC.4